MPTVTLSDFWYVLGIAVLAAVALSNFLAARSKATTDAQATADTAMSRALAALQAEVAALKDANHRLELLVTEYRGKVEMLEQHNQELKDMVAARPEWQMLMQTVAKQGEQVAKQAETAKRIDALLDSIPKDAQERQEQHYRDTETILDKLSAA